MTKPKPKPKAKAADTQPLVSGSNNAHAKLSPSHFSTNLLCPASLTMEEGLPNESSAAAAEGTAMHHVAECVLNNWLSRKNQSGGKDAHAYVGVYPLATASNAGTAEAKVKFTKDMADLITPYIEYVKQLREANAYTVIKLEQRVDLTGVLGVDVPTFGTADLVALIPDDKEGWILEVGDLKTGRGKVLAEGVAGSRSGNMQLMGYACGLYAKYTAEGYTINCIRLGIHGPRMGLKDGRDFFDVHPVAMKTWPEAKGKVARASLSLLKNGKKHLTAFDFNPGPQQCQWCRAAKEGLCAAKNRAIMSEFEDDAPQVVTVQPAAAKPKPKGKPKPKPKSADDAAKPAGAAVDSSDGTEKNPSIELTPDEIVAAYAKLPDMKKHIEFIEKAMQRLMFQGEGHPDYKLISVSGGARVVKDEEALIAVLKGARFKDEQIFSRRLLGIGKLEELVADKPRVLKKVQELLVKPESKTGIALRSDPRPEYNGATKDDLACDD